jgi:hypothetical protein
MFYQKKYLKYKNKYYNLKNMIGGASQALDKGLSKISIAFKLLKSKVEHKFKESDITVQESNGDFSSPSRRWACDICHQCAIDASYYPRYNLEMYDTDVCEMCVVKKIEVETLLKAYIPKKDTPEEDTLEEDTPEDPSLAARNELRKLEAIKILYNLHTGDENYKNIPEETIVEYGKKMKYIDDNYEDVIHVSCDKCKRKYPNPRYTIEDYNLDLCWHCVNEHIGIRYKGHTIKQIFRSGRPKFNEGEKIYKYMDDWHIMGNGYD